MSYDLDAMQKLLNQKNAEKQGGSGGQKNDLLWYSIPKEDLLPNKQPLRIKIRLLPPWEGAGIPGMVVKKHYDVPGEKSRLCFDTHGMDCVICDVLREYSTRFDVEPWVASGKAYMNCLVLEDPTYTTQYGRPLDTTAVHIISVSEHFFYWVIEKIMSPDVGDFLDLRSGHNLTLWRKSYGKSIEKEIALKPTPVANSEDGIEAIKKSIVNLHKIWKKPDDEFNKYQNQIANNLRKQIEERIVGLTQGTNASQGNIHTSQSVSTPSYNQPPKNEAPAQEQRAPAPTPQASAPVSAPVPSSAPAMTPAANTGVKKPAGSPNCYADKGTYNEDREDCINCAFEFACKKDIERG